jgi:hypothetical protein
MVRSVGRNRYVDLVRLVAILVVMGGHWLATIIVVGDGQPRGRSALATYATGMIALWLAGAPAPAGSPRRSRSDR